MFFKKVLTKQEREDYESILNQVWEKKKFVNNAGFKTKIERGRLFYQVDSNNWN